MYSSMVWLWGHSEGMTGATWWAVDVLMTLYGKFRSANLSADEVRFNPVLILSGSTWLKRVNIDIEKKVEKNIYLYY